jgi:hypothetical protein
VAWPAADNFEGDGPIPFFGEPKSSQGKLMTGRKRDRTSGHDDCLAPDVCGSAGGFIGPAVKLN